MVEYTKRDSAFRTLRAVCLVTSDKLLNRDYSGIVLVEQFDIPNWGCPQFSVKEGTTVAVATDGRRMVIAESDLELGGYKILKSTQSNIQLERIELERNQFPN